MDETKTAPTVELTALEKENFFKAFLSEQPYQETFELFGGKYKVTFKTLTLAESDDIIKQLTYDQHTKKVDMSNGYYSTLITYRLALAITDANGIDLWEELTKDKIPEDKVAGDTYLNARSELIRNWPDFKVAGIQTAYEQFERKVLALTKELENPTFWKAAV